MITNLKSIFLLLQVQLVGFPARQTSCVDLCHAAAGTLLPLVPGGDQLCYLCPMLHGARQTFSAIFHVEIEKCLLTS